MPINETSFEVQWRLGGHNGVCCCVLEHDTAADSLRWLLVEQSGNIGMSVTNASHLLLPAIQQHLAPRGRRNGVDRWYEAYEYRIAAHRGFDPDVMEVVWPGGAWLPVAQTAQPMLVSLFSAWRRLAKHPVTI